MDKTEPPFPLPGSDDSVEAVRDFNLLYGTALAAWAYLEEVLGLNFHRLIGTHPNLARQLFFSGRSFATRADLYSAAISGSIGLTDKRREAHKLLLKRARQYASARNSIAHGIPVNLMGGGTYQGLRIKQGHKVWEPGGVSRDNLLDAAENFQGLSTAARTLLNSRNDDDEAAELCLKQVRELPTEAFPPEDAQNQQEGE
jgi:hypothetical protein